MQKNMRSFLFGTIEIKIFDGFYDLLLSEISKRKIHIINLVKSDNDITVLIRYNEFREFSEISESCGYTVRIVRRYGLPYIFFRYRKRAGIPLGIAIGAFIIFILSSCIWSIDISGNEIILSESIEQFLASEGISRGTFSDTIMCNQLEYMLEEKFEGISWVTASVIGSRLFIDIKERETDDLFKEGENYSNIVALKDGEIVSCDIFNGEGKIYPGTAVVKGDLLVSGVQELRDGSSSFVDSDARILARTKNYIVTQTAQNISADTIDECKEIYLPYVFGRTIYGAEDDKYNYFTENLYLVEWADIFLPLGVKRFVAGNMTKKHIELTEKQAYLLAFSDFAAESVLIYDRCEIISREISFSLSEKSTIEAEYLCIEDISEKRIILIEEE